MSVTKALVTLAVAIVAVIVIIGMLLPAAQPIIIAWQQMIRAMGGVSR